MQTDTVTGTAFFAREDCIQALEKRIQAFLRGYRQNIALTGKISLGKSSLLQHFLQTYQNPDLVAVYIEIRPEPFDYFAQKFMGSLLASFLRSRGEAVPQEFNMLITRSRRLLPNTLKKMRGIMRLLGQEEWDAAFREMLTLTQLLKEETGKQILLILDNFDSLEELELTDPYNEFGKAIMVQIDTLYLVAANSDRKAEIIFKEKLSLLFGNFEILQIKPFDFSTCQRFLDERLPGVEISDGVKKFLVELTDGHPYFLDTLVREIRVLLEKRKENALAEEVLTDALEHELFRKSGCLHQYFVIMLKAMGRDKTFYASLKVLLAISLGFKKVQQIGSYLHRKADDVKKILAKLYEEELVEKKGSFFTINTPLFNFWLRHVYYRRELDFFQRAETSVEVFRQEVRTLIARRVEEERKELTKKVEELFQKFRNDVVELESKKIMCPHFTEVYFKPSNGRVFPVEAKAPNTRWICQVACKRVTEDDVRLFIQDIHKLKHKVQKKIMIAMQGIELNATLLAKEARIMLWSLKNVNALLELYDRPKVIM